MILLFILFAHLSLACLNVTRNDLLDCFRTLIDTNADLLITKPELSHFLRNNSVYDVSDRIFIQCDLNKDDALSYLDWESPQACCRTNGTIFAVCRICRQAGWVR
jgi:hypothetical protein